MKKKSLITHSQHFVLTNDKIIRTALKEKLEESYFGIKNTKIIEELGITHGEARIDIAVVNGVIHGYELKSDRDTLKRLPGQIEIYNTVLDKVTLVVGMNHLHEAMKIVPDWWGITIAKIVNSDSVVSFFNIREPEENKNQNSAAVAALLWREEALKILENIGQAKGMQSKSRKAIYEKLADVLEKKSLNKIVREQLRTRVNWRSDLQCIPSGG
ncbi:MAG: sce7726 family protein [Parcubacteria group bacterium]